MRLGALYQTSEKARFSNAIGRGALQGRCNRRISDPDCRSANVREETESRVTRVNIGAGSS